MRSIESVSTDVIDQIALCQTVERSFQIRGAGSENLSMSGVLLVHGRILHAVDLVNTDEGRLLHRTDENTPCSDPVIGHSHSPLQSTVRVTCVVI